MIDHLEEIDSDLSVFHRVDDPDALSAPRFLKLARHLHHYDGALRRSLQLQAQRQAPAAVPGRQSASLDTSPEVLARMSEAGSDRFPGIEYD